MIYSTIEMKFNCFNALLIWLKLIHFQLMKWDTTPSNDSKAKIQFIQKPLRIYIQIQPNLGIPHKRSRLLSIITNILHLLVLHMLKMIQRVSKPVKVNHRSLRIVEDMKDKTKTDL